MSDTLKNFGAAKAWVEARLVVGKGGNCLKKKSKYCPVERPKISIELNRGSNPLSLIRHDGTIHSKTKRIERFG